MKAKDKVKSKTPKKKKRTPEPWEADLEKLVETVSSDGKPVRTTVLMDIFRTAMKLAKESPGTLNLKITSTTLRELRYSFKMFSRHRHAPKITIFGSARVPRGTPLYNFTKDFAAKAVKRKFMVITGGGPGIMAAGNEGADTSGFGLNIRLPVEQDPNPYIDQESMLVNYKYFFTRKLFLVKEASGFAFLPGGFGTFDEAFEVLTLLQTGKSNLIPVVMLEPPGMGYWKTFMDFVEKGLLKHGFISDNDFALFKIFTDAEEALDYIDQFYRVYHSMRFVKEKLVVRIKHPLSPQLLKDLSMKFAPLTKGKFEQRGPMDEEANEPEFNQLTRLVFTLDKLDYGMLRQLIDFINEKTR